MMKKVMIVFGTRPEAIKMAPVIKALSEKDGLNTIVTVTGQHREMLDQVLYDFQITPDYDLNIMEKGQTLTCITTRILTKLGEILEKEHPKIILVHGDTSTTFSASLAAFYRKIPVGHVEAGLRTFNKYAPFPEEMNRKFTDCLSDLLFAPTKHARNNLIKEGLDEKKIFVTGNTVVDALLQTVCKDFSYDNQILAQLDLTGKKNILLTCHRRENIGEPMEDIFQAVREIAESNKDIQIIFPVHLNKKIREPAYRNLSNIENVFLTEPLVYREMVNLMNDCFLVLTDSGGIQEEAAALGRPVLVLRDTTERPEGLERGISRLIGTKKNMIEKEVTGVLHDRDKCREMEAAQNPYGDGRASLRIVEILLNYLKSAD